MTKKEEPKPTEEERHELVASILRVLNERKVRATYSAVACILRLHPKSVGENYLGEPRPWASWIVNKPRRGRRDPSRYAKPSGYEDRSLRHPDLCKSRHFITSCCELRKYLCLPPLPPACEHRHGCDGC